MSTDHKPRSIRDRRLRDRRAFCLWRRNTSRGRKIATCSAKLIDPSRFLVLRETKTQSDMLTIFTTSCSYPIKFKKLSADKSVRERDILRKWRNFFSRLGKSRIGWYSVRHFRVQVPGPHLLENFLQRKKERKRETQRKKLR